VKEVKRAVEGWLGEKKNEKRGVASFFLDFGLHPQTMDSRSIYRGGRGTFYL